MKAIEESVVITARQSGKNTITVKQSTKSKWWDMAGRAKALVLVLALGTAQKTKSETQTKHQCAGVLDFSSALWVSAVRTVRTHPAPLARTA